MRFDESYGYEIDKAEAMRRQLTQRGSEALKKEMKVDGMMDFLAGKNLPPKNSHFTLTTFREITS